MLQLYKNQIVTDAAKQQGDVRQRELDFYVNNLWLWGGTSTVLSGFVFSQITNPVPPGTNFYLEITYLVCTSVCLSLNLCIVTWTVFFCMWAPGNALRGPEGMNSFHKTVDFVKDQQRLIHFIFVLSIIAFFGASCTLLWVYPSRTSCNWVSSCVLGVFLIALLFQQCRLEFALGGSVFSHEGPDGRIRCFQDLDNLADLDYRVSRAVPEHQQSYVPGLHTNVSHGMY